jgi:TetR/AcrR family transcriptional regulator, regulator of mycofactocin system
LVPVHQPAWEARTSKTRSDIVAAALGLFDHAGFEATTIEQIAVAAGVARRTFFRYFPSKEAVLFAEFAARQTRATERLRARPNDEPPLQSLISVFRSMCDEPIDTKHVKSVRRIVADSQALRDRQQRIFVDEFAQELTLVLAQRGGSDSTVALHAVVLSAVACIEVATMAHLRHPRSSVRALFDEAVETCRSSWSSLS